MKKILLAAMLSASAYSQTYWCKTEPVSPNGDEYLELHDDLYEACEAAMATCKRQYGPCNIVGCGTYDSAHSTLSKRCIYTIMEEQSHE